MSLSNLTYGRHEDIRRVFYINKLSTAVSWLCRLAGGFTILDSYRTTVKLSKHCVLAFNNYNILRKLSTGVVVKFGYEEVLF